MIDNIFYFIIYPLTLLVSYFVGYHVNRYSEVAEHIQKRLKKKSKGVIIDYITPEDEEYIGSEQEKIDQAQEKLFRESGIL